jgi:hypothetical protein
MCVDLESLARILTNSNNIFFKYFKIIEMTKLLIFCNFAIKIPKNWYHLQKFVSKYKSKTLILMRTKK